MLTLRLGTEVLTLRVADTFVLRAAEVVTAERLDTCVEPALRLTEGAAAERVVDADAEREVEAAAAERDVEAAAERLVTGADALRAAAVF